MRLLESCLPSLFTERSSGKRRVSDEKINDPSKAWSFVTRQGGVLYDNNVPFRFASYNVPGLLLTEDRSSDPSAPWLPPTPEEQEDAILTVKGAFGRVIRTYTLGFGPFHHQSAPGVYYEPAWVAMDNALALAGKHRIRLVIPIVNNHFKGDQGGPENFGDYWTLCNYRELLPSAFYTSPILREDMKALITFLLNRINTVNGIRYGDDPTILAWQLGNELGGWDGPAPPPDWSLEMAALIKALAPNTLVMDGTMGGLTSSRMYHTECLSSPLIDIFDNHYYHGLSTDLKCVKRDVDLVVKTHKKAFVLGEFGFDFNTCFAMYKTALNNKHITGALIWSLRYHSRDGGFYIHGEVEPEKGYWSYHAPGFKESRPGFSVDDHRMLLAARAFGLKMMKIKDPGFSVPPPVRRAARSIVSPSDLTWMGSPWAASYNIYRREGDG